MKVLLVQLPIPQLNFGKQTGNVPMGAACLKQAAVSLPHTEVEILPESVASHVGDAALLQTILDRRADIIGFTVFSWNIGRCLYFAKEIKKRQRSKVIFGGSEITADNPLLPSPDVDFAVFGEGEVVFRQLLQDTDLWRRHASSSPAESIFKHAPSPYIAGLLEAHIENTVLLETQRGCPYTCAYCYYSKSVARPVHADLAQLRRAVRWALDQSLGEIYFLDPSFHVRPDIEKLLHDIGGLNADRRMGLLSEIRAESITPAHADLFAEAGFTWFEIGLQSTNPTALEIMHRPTDLRRFLRGVQLLKARGIRFGIDLIAGLPGDDLQGFKRSVDFVVDNGLNQDVLVFPLSVLPGTEFRRLHKSLGLEFDPHPPYIVRGTPGFSGLDLQEAMIYAESKLDIALYPMPDLDLSWRQSSTERDVDAEDRWISFGTEYAISKLLLFRERPIAQLSALARRLAHPYQVFFGRQAGRPDYVRDVLVILSATNPHTPFEVIFMDAPVPPDVRQLLGAIRLARPGYLDQELQFLHDTPGNRSVLFSILSPDPAPMRLAGMQRQIFWWRQTVPPRLKDLEALMDLDGVLVDPPPEYTDALTKWQDGFAHRVEQLPLISFSDMGLQNRWRALTQPDDYYLPLFSATSQ